MAITEGTTALPVDNNGRRLWGVLDRLAGVFRIPSGSPEGNLIVQLEKGTRSHFIAAPTDVATVIRAAKSTRRSLIFINWGSATVYVGPSGVTTATGTPIPQYGVVTDSDGTEAWYGICTAALTADVRGWETAG